MRWFNISLVVLISVIVLAQPGASAGRVPDPQEEVVVLPECDFTDPSVRMIGSVGDWADINDPAYRVFCVSPGDYRSLGLIDLTVSGTESMPRVVRYFRPADPNDDTHPVHMAEADQALIQHLRFVNADYWVIDRLAIVNDDLSVSLLNRGIEVGGSSHNVMQRLLVTGGRVGVLIFARSDFNVLQRSVVRDTLITPGDSNCINLHNYFADENQTGNRIVSNEVYDCTDSLQLVAQGVSAGSTFPGTVVANNDFFLTPDRYTNCDGVFDEDGDCACAEGRFDIKGGGTSADPEGLVHVTRNRIWGARTTDPTPECGGGSSWGSALGTCCGPDIAFVLIEDNIIFDSARGIETGSSIGMTIRDNVIYDIYSDYGGPAFLNSGDTVEIYRNVVINATSLGYFGGDSTDMRCNAIINMGAINPNVFGMDIEADYNGYFSSVQVATPGTHDVVSNNVNDAHHHDLCFDRRLITGPEQFCIPHGKIGLQSPMRTACDPQLGSRPGIGIDDELLPGFPPIPALSNGGLAFLAALFVASTLWFFRAR